MMNNMYSENVRQAGQTVSRPRPIGRLARYRLTLIEGETYILPPGTREVHIRFGTACILDGEHEGVLRQGEMQEMASEVGAISSMYGHEPVVFEIALDAESEASQQLKHHFYERMAAHQQLIEVESRNSRQ